MQAEQAQARPEPPDDLSLLRDARVSEPLVDESAAEHIRNALQVLVTGWTAVKGTSIVNPTVEYAYADVAAMHARLQNAVDILESPTVLTGESLASFMHDLAQRSV